jgi:hypothetical protein
MSVLVDALWFEVLRYAYLLSAGPWPEWLARGMLGVVVTGCAIAAWRLRGRPGHGAVPPARPRLRFDSPAGRG